jgi:hypothetical protein
VTEFGFYVVDRAQGNTGGLGECILVVEWRCCLPCYEMSPITMRFTLTLLWKSIGGAFAFFYGVGRPLPFPEGKPYKMSLRRRLFTALTRLLSKFSKKKKSDDE